MRKMMFNIYEFDHSVMPGEMNDYFEVYSESDSVNPIYRSEYLDEVNPIYRSEYLDEVVAFCYASGNEFTVHTLQAYYNENGE
jgi:hypothetical protein